MAVDFLKKLGSYIDMVGPNVCRRRGAVAPWLGADYRFPRGQAERALNDVRTQLGRKNLSLSTILADAEVYRAAFLFLHDLVAHDELLQACEEEPDADYLVGVRALIVEGIETWKEFESRFSKPTKKTTSSASAGLQRTLRKLQQQVAALLADKQALQDKLAVAMEALSKGDDAQHLREVAAKSPEDAQVSAIVADLETDVAAAKRKMLELAARLPKVYHWESGLGDFVYEEAFLCAVVGFTADEQRQFVSSLEYFAADRTHTSLKSKRIGQRDLHAPPRSMMSRASRELRFAWKHANSVVTIYYAWRRGDSRFGQSEA
jgi:hypothetical protein